MNEELKEMRDEMKENHKQVSGALIEMQKKLNDLTLKIALQEVELARLDKVLDKLTGGLSKVFWLIVSTVTTALVLWVMSGGLDGKG